MEETVKSTMDDIDNNIPIFHHLLDGLINVHVGNTIEKVSNFFSKNKLNKNSYDVSLIDYTEMNITDQQPSNTICGWKYYLLSNTVVKNSKFKTENIIMQLVEDRHGTSIYFFSQNNKYYMASINSGYGIEKHKSIKMSGQIYYTPYVIFEIGDKRDESANESLIFKIINLILFLKKIYGLMHITQKITDHYYIAKIYLVIKEYISDVNLIDPKLVNIRRDNVTTPIYDFFLSLYTDTTISEVDKAIKTAKDNLVDIEINLKKDCDDNPAFSDYYYEIYQVQSVEISEKITQLEKEKIQKIKKLYSNFKITSKESFYCFLIETLKKIYRTCGLESIPHVTDGFEIETEPSVFYNEDFELNDRLIKKLIVYKNITESSDKDLYILEQESGSCLWFALYWAIILNIIIYGKNFLKYSNYVKNINKKMVKLAHTIFNVEKLDNFIKMCINHEYDASKYQYILNIIQKLCLVNVLKIQDYFKYYDIIHNFKINFTNFPLFQDSVPINKKIYKLRIVKKIVDGLFNIQTLLFPVHDDDPLSLKIIRKIPDINKEVPSLEYHGLNFKKEHFHMACYYLFLKEEINVFKSVDNIDLFIQNIIEIRNSIISDLTNIEHKMLLTEQLNNDRIHKIRLLINNYNYVVGNSDMTAEYIPKFYLICNYLYEYLNLETETRPPLIKFMYFVKKIWFFILIQNTLVQRILVPLQTHPISVIIERNKIKNYCKKVFELLYSSFFRTIDQEIIDTLESPELISSYDVIPKDDILLFMFEKNNKLLNFKIYNDQIEYGEKFMNIYEHYEVNLEKYVKLNTFLLENPQYVFFDFNDNFDDNSSDSISFFMLNREELNKPLNIKVRENVLEFLMTQYYYYKKQVFLMNALFVQNIIPRDLLTETKGYIYKNENTINFNQYEMYVNKKLTLPIDEFIKLNITNEQVIHSNIINMSGISISPINYEIMIDDMVVERVRISNSFTYNMFCLNDVVTFKNDNTYYFFYNGGIIVKIISDVGGNISKIYVNGNLVEKWETVSDGFKYLSPMGCLQLIYKENNVYNILYFVSKNNINTGMLHGEVLDEYLVEYFSGLYNLKINPINMLLPDKKNQDINIFEEICLKNGVNNFNYIFINKVKNNLGYYYNKNNESYFINKNAIFTTEIEEDDHVLGKFINYINKPEKCSVTLVSDKIQDKILDIYSLMMPKNESDHLVITKTIEKLEKYASECSVNREKIQKQIVKVIESLNRFIENYKILLQNTFLEKKTLFSIFDNVWDFRLMYTSLLFKNSCNILYYYCIKGDDAEICSQIKILASVNDFRQSKFNYLYELFFEFVIGSKVLDEQYKKYVSIINFYHSYKNIKINAYTDGIKNTIVDVCEPITMGGALVQNTEYPLYHFMMGKGKSAIITPLLMLYFSIIHKKDVYIIVPEHLKNQTIKELSIHIKLFGIQDKIFIHSDGEIKKMFLEDKILKDAVFLIDEFDTILDPTKSNFNMTDTKNKETVTLYKTILDIFGLCYTNIKNLNKQNIEYIEYYLKRDEFNINPFKNKDYLIKDIISILNNLLSNKLKENINWGIHPVKCCAIPYASKDSPLLSSNFSSPILTIFLTIYHYIIIKNGNLSDLIVNFIINNDLNENIINFIESYDSIITKKSFNKMIQDRKLWAYTNIILPKIFSKIMLASTQSNVSFVDIINMDNIFKIGYSGTMNIDLPNLTNKIKFKNINKDYDEQVNVIYALKCAIIIFPEKYSVHKITDNLRNYDDLKIYDALIDTAGVFKDWDNKILAQELYNKLDKRPTIYLDKNDNIFVICNDKISHYDPNIKYINPFFYYSQKHTVGIDIKQDMYPILKGLCVIDNNSTYSQVAQSIFRLRKINMGHSIDIIMCDTCDDKFDLITFLMKNEEIVKSGKKNFLNFQCVKSDIRKLRHETDTKTKHIEYNNYYIDETKSISELLESIFRPEEIKDVLNHPCFKEITLCLTKSSDLIDLIYNINSLQSSTEMDRMTEMETLTQNEQQREFRFEINKNTEENITKTEKITNHNFFIPYKDNYISQLDKNYDNIVLHFDEDIDYVPNMLCDIHKDGINRNNFVFVYINIKNKLLIIQSTDIGLFIDKYPVLNYKLISMNDIKIDSDVRKRLNKKFEFKLLNDIYNVEYEEIDSYYDLHITTIKKYFKLYILFNLLTVCLLLNDKQNYFCDKLITTDIFRNIYSEKIKKNSIVIDYYRDFVNIIYSNIDKIDKSIIIKKNLLFEQKDKLSIIFKAIIDHIEKIVEKENNISTDECRINILDISIYNLLKLTLIDNINNPVFLSSNLNLDYIYFSKILTGIYGVNPNIFKDPIKYILPDDNKFSPIDYFSVLLFYLCEIYSGCINLFLVEEINNFIRLIYSYNEWFFTYVSMKLMPANFDMNISSLTIKYTQYSNLSKTQSYEKKTEERTSFIIKNKKQIIKQYHYDPENGFNLFDFISGEKIEWKKKYLKYKIKYLSLKQKIK